MLQLTLLSCLLFYIVILPAIHVPHECVRWPEDDPGHSLIPYVRLLTKFVCCVLLHINMQPKILENLDRMFYIMLHPNNFD